LHRIIASPNATTDENGHDFKRASADAEFLFRDEVVKDCKMVEKAIFDLATYNAQIKEAPVGQEREELVAKSRIAIDHIRKFYDEDFRFSFEAVHAVKRKGCGGETSVPLNQYLVAEVRARGSVPVENIKNKLRARAWRCRMSPIRQIVQCREKS